MGFHAPSAEEVYRYALRLDRRGSLVDRFGFSIILVNDNSPACREFLTKYCLDLCWRTADRIRFIFFSEIPESELRRFAEEMNRGSSGHDSLLSGIVDAIGARSEFDYEAEPWLRLRPFALRPLRRGPDIERRVRWECDLHTAMPGTGIAMAFAQRLGIGRHVPCILAFTEVGELSVGVLPIGQLGADRAFDHVRTWVDRFYEVNQERISFWQSIEEQIERFVREARSSLVEIQRWRDARQKAWRELVAVSRAIHRLENADRESLQAWFGRARTGPESPSRLRRALDSAAVACRDLAEREEKCALLERWSNELGTVTEVGDLQAILPKLQADLRGRVHLPSLDTALGEVENQSLLFELRVWWQRSGGWKLSLRHYSKMRAQWTGLSPSADEASLLAEHRALLGWINALPVTSEPAEGARRVLEQLDLYLGPPGAGEDIRSLRAEFTMELEGFLKQVQTEGPAWVYACEPVLSIGEAVPLGEVWSPGLAARRLYEKPRLRDALVIAAGGGDAGAITRHRRECLMQRDRVLGDLGDQIGSCRASGLGFQEIRERALTELEPLRSLMETEALTLAARGIDERTPVDRQLAIRLHAALDEYERVTSEIEFPHDSDPAVRRVELRVSVAQAAGVGIRREPSVIELFRTQLDDAALARESEALVLEKARQEASNAHPLERLRAAMNKCVGPRSPIATDLIPALSGPQVAQLLASLLDSERVAVGQGLGCPPSVDGILTALGLFPGGSQTPTSAAEAELATKVRMGAFDVFLAHNSRDKEAVLTVAQQLRLQGLYPWVDDEQILPGRPHQDAIQVVIPRVRAAAVFLGSHGLGKWQEAELRALVTQSVERQLPVIPVLLPGVQEVPIQLAFLREMNAVHFRKGPTDVEALSRLVQGINGKAA
jgi:nucleotide-binding universal stress UspA family protein